MVPIIQGRGKLIRHVLRADVIVGYLVGSEQERDPMKHGRARRNGYLSKSNFFTSLPGRGGEVGKHLHTRVS
jgi:hypothetical protein